MTYRIELRPAARRDLARLPRKQRRLIAGRIDALADDPRPATSKPLGGDLRGRLSMRVGGYRVVYRVEDDMLVVVVIRIGPRGRIYGEAGRAQE